jgi:hypothetical protein
MITPQRERHPAPEVPSSGFASHQAVESGTDSTSLSVHCGASGVDWTGRRDFVAAWLPHATREAVEAFALRHFDRGESAAFLVAEQIERDELKAQREASYAVCEAEDWTAASRRPSHAQLVARRSVVA